MSEKYSITDDNTLIFTGKPKSLNEYSVKKKDKENLTSIVIPNSVSTIDKYAFNYFSTVASVHIPNSVSTIDAQAFGYCWAIASIHIPNSIETVKPWAFDECLALAAVHIPNSVSTIGAWSFYGCSHLHKAYIHNNSKLITDSRPPFDTKTAILRPRLKPIIVLQKKAACRASKIPHSIYL